MRNLKIPEYVIKLVYSPTVDGYESKDIVWNSFLAGT